MRTNQRYQLLAENLPTLPSWKNTKYNGKTQNVLASPTPNQRIWAPLWNPKHLLGFCILSIVFTLIIY
jgi:hypothetical protein